MKKKLNKNSSNKLLQGAVLGAALTIAAGIVLSSPKTKKALKDKITRHHAEFNRYIAPRLKRLKKVSQDDYQALIDQAIKSYGKVSKLSAKELDELSDMAKGSWEDIKANLK